MTIIVSPGQMQLQQRGAPPVILASASATRAGLLRNAGLAFEQRPVGVDEGAAKDALRAEGIDVRAAVVALAELKAQRLAASAQVDAIVLGADQILSFEGQWFDKPQDRLEAREQLGALAGRKHELPTAVVAFRGGVRVWHHVTAPRIWLRPCTPEFLDRYLEALGDEVLSSVGIYQVEGLGAQLLARIEGDTFAILGLPLLETLEFLRVQGVLAR